VTRLAGFIRLLAIALGVTVGRQQTTKRLRGKKKEHMKKEEGGGKRTKKKIAHGGRLL